MRDVVGGAAGGGRGEKTAERPGALQRARRIIVERGRDRCTGGRSSRCSTGVGRRAWIGHGRSCARRTGRGMRQVAMRGGGDGNEEGRSAAGDICWRRGTCNGRAERVRLTSRPARSHGDRPVRRGTHTVTLRRCSDSRVHAARPNSLCKRLAFVYGGAIFRCTRNLPPLLWATPRRTSATAAAALHPAVSIPGMPVFFICS